MVTRNSKIQNNLQANINEISEKLGWSSDLMIRTFTLKGIGLRVSIIFFEGSIDAHSLETHIIEPLMTFEMPLKYEEQGLLNFLIQHVIQVKAVRMVESMEDAIHEIVNGKTLLVVDDMPLFISADIVKWNEKGLTNPKAQRVTKGPDIAFTENRTTNISLLRKVIKNPDLRIETKSYGKKTSTDVSIVYLDTSVQNEILTEIKKRLDKIELEVVLESNYIEEGLTEESKSIFPLMLNTDRPDVVAAEILEGKIGIIVDGSPFVLVAPAVFIQFFQTPEDYYIQLENNKWLRLFKMILYAVSIVVPGLYVAFTTHHPNLLPIQLLISFVSQREVVPFPTVVEIILLGAMIEAIYEASNRVPQNVVLTISVFGAIVLGQSAVESQLIQPATLVVMSASYIMTSVVPIWVMRNVARYLVLIFIIAGATFGLYGIFLATLIVLFHLCNLRSFGVPYLAPFAPFRVRDQKDGLLRSSIEDVANNFPVFSKEETLQQTEDDNKN
ncbi:spore germination protein [Ectobacillus antri]|uniref:Spore germination protein n=1 Tax=Ectobacillus antri TaxID=2486280 RepID=A0ABT6H3N2_9BACI|nr:spore germination protein [Ectobacillus antri]MDG4656590.1 spore germination protein [Ectobacillus antri]MDG5753640.1 spore germination protein [Ectobacillus antri]